MSIYSNPVDSVMAKIIAINYYYSLTNKKTTIKKIEISTYKERNTYYTFVFQNNDWVVVAADDASEPIIAFSTEGSYSDEKPPVYIDWMHGYDIEINYLQENKISNQKVISQWNEIKNNNINFNRSSSVYPLLSTKWGQAFPNDDLTKTIPAYNYYSPENTNCPTNHCEAGCVAVAMAQILRTWRAPVCPQFVWNNMPYELNYNSNPNYEIQRNAIAYLILQCGLKTNMDYCDILCYSASYITDALSAFINDFDFRDATYLKKSDFNWHQWRKIIRDELDLHRPIFYRGNGSQSGHAWVCDGYKSVFLGYQYHFNWGWNGAGNGYYQINDDNPVAFANGMYIPLRDDQEMIINLYPFACVSSLTIGQSLKYIDYNLFYHPKAAHIFAYGVTLDSSDIVDYKAYNDITLQNFETEDGAEFTAEIIPCPYQSNCDFDDLNKSFFANQFYVNDTLIEERNLNNNQDIKIYPNPTDGKFSFEITNFDASKVSVKVFNVFGKEILNKKTTKNNGILDLTHFSPGIYFVEIHYSNRTFKDKIIKIK